MDIFRRNLDERWMFSSLEQFRYLYPPVRIQDSGETFFLFFARTSICGKYARNLSENADRVHRINIRDDVAIRILVLEKESTEVGLSTLHHLLNGSDYCGIANDNSLVKTGKERASSDRESKDLWIYFRDGLFGYRTRRGCPLRWGRLGIDWITAVPT